MPRKLTGCILIAVAALAYWVLLGALENSAAYYQAVTQNIDQRYKASIMTDGAIPAVINPDPIKLKVLLSFTTFPFMLFSLACVAVMAFGLYLVMGPAFQSSRNSRLEFRSRKK